jgi:hypothetical protein
MEATLTQPGFLQSSDLALDDIMTVPNSLQNLGGKWGRTSHLQFGLSENLI